MKNVLLVNIGEKKFGTELKATFDNTDVKYTAIRLRNLVFDTSKNGVIVYHKNKKLNINTFDYAFIRVRGKYSHTSALLTRVLEYNNVPYNDIANREHTDTMEKTVQMVRLANANIHIPHSFIFNADAFEENQDILIKNIKYPCVLKIDGSQGRSVWQINTYDELQKKIKDFSIGTLVTLQDYMENKYDLRVLCWYGDILGAIKRISQDGFYNNVSKGGIVEKYNLAQDDAHIALQSMSVLDADFGGVDLMHTQYGTVVIEVNTGPQVYGFESAHNISIGEVIANKLKAM